MASLQVLQKDNRTRQDSSDTIPVVKRYQARQSHGPFSSQEELSNAEVISNSPEALRSARQYMKLEANMQVLISLRMSVNIDDPERWWLIEARPKLWWWLPRSCWTLILPFITQVPASTTKWWQIIEMGNKTFSCFSGYETPHSWLPVFYLINSLKSNILGTEGLLQDIL